LSLKLFLSLPKTRTKIYISIYALNDTNFVYVYFRDTCGTSNIDPHNQPSQAHTYPFVTLYRATSSEGLHARALFMRVGESFSKFGVYVLRRERMYRARTSVSPRLANPIAQLMRLYVSLLRHSFSPPPPCSHSEQNFLFAGEYYS